MGSTRDHIASSGLERDMTEVPHTVRTPDLGEPSHKVVTVFDQGTTSILAQMHRGGAGMVRLSDTRHLDAADADDAGHDTDLFAFALQPRALLNMSFQIGDM